MFRCLICDQRGPETCRNLEDDGQGKVDGYFVLKRVLEVPEETWRGRREVEVNLCVGCVEKVERCKRLWMDYLEVKRELVGKIKELEGVRRRNEEGGGGILEETRNFVKKHNYEEDTNVKGFLEEVDEMEVKKEEMEEVTDEDDKEDLEDDHFMGFQEEIGEVDDDQEMEETVSDPDFEEDLQSSNEEEDQGSSSWSEESQKAPRSRRKVVIRRKRKTRTKKEKHVNNRSSSVDPDCPLELCQVTCDLCGVTFQGKSSLQDHKRTNHPADNLKCNICNKSFANVHTLRTHLKDIHLEKGRNLCEICGKAISTRGMKLHLQTKHNIGNLKKYTCSEPSCGKSFYQKGKLQTHQFNHRPRKDWPFHCSSCGAAFLTKNKVTRHELRHTNVNSRSFMCDQCPKSFRVYDDLYCHKRQVHQKKMPEEINKCEICSRTFVKLASLERHKELVHERKFEVECDLCATSFLDGTRLKMHKKLAHGGDSGGDHQGNGGNKREKKHKCGVCGKAFATNFMLSDHSTTHGGEPKYKCSYNNCGKAFYNYIAWHRHEKGVHENRDEKRFKCEICKKGFAHANYLNRHKKTHKK